MLDTKNKYVYCRPCDLASITSINEFVKRFKSEQTRLDVLINNAGVMKNKREITQDGFETHLGVNYMGHFLLTNLLLDTLKISKPSRIINVTCANYRNGTINIEDLNSENEFNPKNAYAQSKLANVLFTNELNKRFRGKCNKFMRYEGKYFDVCCRFRCNCNECKSWCSQFGNNSTH